MKPPFCFLLSFPPRQGLDVIFLIHIIMLEAEPSCFCHRLKNAVLTFVVKDDFVMNFKRMYEHKRYFLIVLTKHFQILTTNIITLLN